MVFSFHSFRATTTVLALASLAACSSKKDDTTPTTPAGLSWTVDGAAISTINTQSQKNSSLISVAGTATSATTSNYLSLEIPNAVGTYTFGGTSPASATYSTTVGSTRNVYYAGALPSTSGVSVAGAGTIVVTTLTATNIAGTFTFTGINTAGTGSKSLTNGTFNVGL